MAMRIIVDRTACDSQAVCTELAPDIFTIDDDDIMQVLNEYPDEEARQRVTAAVNSCPKAAISIVEE
jgi:ferredoxin